MASIVERLTEGIVNRDMRSEGHALLAKWERTGLLEGLENDRTKQTMARLLENQAKELLRESSSMAGGDVEGFAAVAFPIVRRVFAGLIANDLVSVQPMSLPSGLIFFLDFTISTEAGDHATTTSRLGYDLSSSLYGGNAVASAITGGVDLTQQMGDAGGPYNLNNAYTSPTGSSLASAITLGAANLGASMWGESSGSSVERDARYDPDFVSGSTAVAIVSVKVSGLDQLNWQGPQSFNVSSSAGNGILRDSTTAGVARLIRRHTRISGNLDPDQDTNAVRWCYFW